MSSRRVATSPSPAPGPCAARRSDQARSVPAPVGHGRRDAGHGQRAGHDAVLADHHRRAGDGVGPGGAPGSAPVRPRPKSRAVRGSASADSRSRERDEGGVARLREVRREGHGAGRPALEVLEQLAADGDRLGAVDGVARLQAVAQQRRGGDDLERRARRVAPVDRAVVGRVGRAVGDGEDVARGGLHGDQRRLGLRVAERLLGRLLDVAVQGRAQLAALAARPAEQRRDRRAAAVADDDAPRRRAGELVLERASRPHWPIVADAELALRALDLLGVAGPTAPSRRARSSGSARAAAVPCSACTPWIASTRAASGA